MDKDKIFALIDNYKARYRSPIVEANGFTRCVPQIIDQVTHYMNSQFITKSKNNNRTFYNVTKPAVDTYAKNIDLDTKDIVFRAKRSEDRIRSYFLNRKLEQFNSDYNSGYFLNLLERRFVEYGTAIVRNMKDEMPELVDLHHFYFDVHATPKQSTFDLQGDFAIYETQKTITELEDNAEYENVDKVASAFYKANEKKIVKNMVTVLDCEMICQNKLFGGERGTGLYHVVVAYDDAIEVKEILYYKKIKKLDYKAFSGLNAGIGNFKIGIPEMIFDDQAKINLMMTYYADGNQMASLNVFQTQDPTTMKNILSQAKNGDIFNMTLGRVDTAVLNPTQFINFKELMEDIIRRKTNSYEVLTGENLPSNQTLGGAVLQTQAGGKLFEIERENLGLFIDELYTDWIIPIFERTLKEKEVIEILDAKALEDIWNIAAKNQVMDAVLTKIMEGSDLPTSEDIDIMIEAQLQEEKKKNLWPITKEYLTEYDKTLYIDTSGEKHNLAQKVSVMSQVLLNSNIIQVLSNPVTAKAGEQLLELVGFDKDLIDLSQAQPQPQMAGGQQQTTSQSGIENIAEQFTKEGEVKQ